MKKIFNKVYIVAEAGVNHNGDLKKAFKLVDIAKKAQVNAIKFQTFRPGEITGRFTEKNEYIKKNIKTNLSRFEISKKLSLSYDAFRKIKNYCKKKKITFLSTPDGEESLNFLVDKLNIPIIKIGSSEITNYYYLDKIASKRRPVILSTGLSNMKEVENAFRILRKKHKKNNITLLQCTSEYPAPINEMNINVINSYRKKFKCNVGLSDHSIGTEASIAAVSLGAKVIEKHFTINKKLPGPDHKASLSPKELIEFVKSIRKTELALGKEKKKISKSEKKNINSIRRGIVAKFHIKAGTIIKKDMITFKRPFVGLNPFEFKKILGLKTKFNIEIDEPITFYKLNEKN